jgi:hypothetical protein
MDCKKLLLSVVTSCSLLSGASEVEQNSSWSYDIQLYMLAVWIKGESQMGPSTQKLDLDVTPNDIFSNLKMGAMAHFEAHQNKGFGVWLDYAFMNLGEDVPLVRGELGIYQGILEAFGTYRVPLKTGTLDYFGGVRWWHNDFDLSYSVLNGGSASRTVDWYDPVVGVRWIYPFANDWSFKARGDIGGFGIGSDFTSVVELGVMYDITQNWQVDVRFKSLWVDYEEGTEGQRDRFTYDTANYGPIIGMTYRF